MTERLKESNWTSNQDFHAIILENEDIRKSDISISDLSDSSDCDERKTECSKSMILMQCDFVNSIRDDGGNVIRDAQMPQEFPQSPESRKKELYNYLKLIKPSDIKGEEFSYNRRSKRVKKLLLEQEKLKKDEPKTAKSVFATTESSSKCQINNLQRNKLHSKSPVKKPNQKKYQIKVKQLVNLKKTAKPAKVDEQSQKTKQVKLYRRMRRKIDWDVNLIITKRKRRKAAINSNYLNVKSFISPQPTNRNHKQTKTITKKKTFSSTNLKQSNNCKLNNVNSTSNKSLSIKSENKQLVIKETNDDSVVNKLENYRVDLKNFFDDTRQLPSVSLEHRKQLLRTLDVPLVNNELNCRKCSRSPDFIGFQHANRHFSFDVYENATNLLRKFLKLKSMKNNSNYCQLASNLTEVHGNVKCCQDNNNSDSKPNISIIEHDYLGFYGDYNVNSSVCLEECDHTYCKPVNSREIDSESDSENESDESESIVVEKSTNNSPQTIHHNKQTIDNNKQIDNNTELDLIVDSKNKLLTFHDDNDSTTIHPRSDKFELNYKHANLKESFQLINPLEIENYIADLKTDDFSLSLSTIDKLRFNGNNINNHVEKEKEEQEDNLITQIENNLTKKRISDHLITTTTDTKDSKELLNQSELIINCNPPSTNFLPFQNGTAQVRSLHKSLTTAAPKRKLSGDEWLCSRNKRGHKILDSTSSHSISIGKENGPVLNVFYVDFNLFICQEFSVSLWQQTALGNILGAQNMWIELGRVPRLVLNGECVRKKSREMVLTNDISVAYVELWTKEHKSDFRQGPLADVFATVYFWKQRQIGLDKKVIQLENIKGFAKDVQYIVCRNSPKIIISWYYVNENKKTTNVHAYELAADFQMLSNVYELQPVNHYVSSLHNIEDCDGLIVGCGDCKITLWNVLYGYKVATIDLNLATPLSTLWVKSDRGFLFVVHEFENLELQLIAINGINHSWKRLASYHPPAGFNGLRGVSIENGILISFYEQGILCWNVQTAEPIVEEIPTETEYIPSGKYVIMIVNDQVIVRHAVTHLIAGDESAL